MTYIRLVGYNLRQDYEGDQVQASCEGEPGQPPCAWRLRFPLAWLLGASQGNRANLEGVRDAYRRHKEEMHMNREDEALRQRQEETIAHLDAILADWDRMKAAGEVASLTDLTRWLHALEARISRLERHIFSQG